MEPLPTETRFQGLYLLNKMMSAPLEIFPYYKDTYNYYKKHWPVDNTMKQLTAIDLLICSFLNKSTIVSGLHYLECIQNYPQEKHALLVLGYTRLIAEHDKVLDAYSRDIIQSSFISDFDCLKGFLKSAQFWKAVTDEYAYVKNEHASVNL